MEEERKLYKLLVECSKEEAHSEDEIRMDLREISWGVEWIYLALDTDRWLVILNTTMNFRVSVATESSYCSDIVIIRFPSRGVLPLVCSRGGQETAELM
jgi:hypothetical protein